MEDQGFPSWVLQTVEDTDGPASLSKHHTAPSLQFQMCETKNLMLSWYILSLPIASVTYKPTGRLGRRHKSFLLSLCFSEDFRSDRNREK